MLEQDRIIKINIEEEMKSSYIDYSMSVIVSRAFRMLEMVLNRSPKNSFRNDGIRKYLRQTL